MIADNNVQDIETLEAFTLYSLDRSQEGIKAMAQEARRCGAALQSGVKALPSELPKIKALAEQLHDFNVFELNLMCLFQLERADFVNEHGSLETVMADFRQALEVFKTRLAFNDLAGSGQVLSEGVGRALTQIESLIPLVRQWIYREFGDGSDVTKDLVIKAVEA